jgi:hypothetical protein
MRSRLEFSKDEAEIKKMKRSQACVSLIKRLTLAPMGAMKRKKYIFLRRGIFNFRHKNAKFTL